MRIKPALTTVAAAALTLVTACTWTDSATTFDDIIAAVDYRADHVATVSGGYIISEGWGRTYHPHRDYFRGEDRFLSNSDRALMANCSSRSWTGKQSKVEPFQHAFLGWQTWGRRADGTDKFERALPDPKITPSLQWKLAGDMIHSTNAQYRNGFSFRFADTSPRKILAHYQDVLGTPFAASAVNHHGCRDAMISFYRGDGGVIGVLIYRQMAKKIEVDHLIGSSADAVQKELTSPTFHWRKNLK